MEENTACVLISSNGDLIRRLGVDTVSLALFVPSLLATLHGQEPVDVHITWHQRYFEMLTAAITECYDHDVLREYLRILAMLLGWKEELAPRIAARIKVGSAMIAGLEETERFREAILTTLEHKAFGFRGQIVASRVRYVAKEAIQPSLSRFTSRLWGKDEKDWLQIQAAVSLTR
ncbi:hypothetical protein BCR35DRAFT_227336 [Leucosporidium creatinivorum]|uniref:Uncharacterized protein n=1 Tax=Leucosporidium creatinivorum TaxID=106004 RepID=A0A1Y2D552_9BASI|nr:hypothetical protein BCR35DRAFT_227336 [Leucosporidium creatinivorum]